MVKRIIYYPIWNEFQNRENFIQSSTQALDITSLDSIRITKNDLKFIKPVYSFDDFRVKILVKIIERYIDKFEKDDREFIWNLEDFINDLNKLNEECDIFWVKGFYEHYNKIEQLFKKYNYDTKILKKIYNDYKNYYERLKKTNFKPVVVKVKSFNLK
jgi:hypothetical protein